MRNNFLIFIILAVGVFYRLLITSDGNFIFNMDNARDMVDVREMVVLNKLRLIGPTSGIEGFFNGPGWYYLLAVPFVLTRGDPYGAVVLMIFLWAVGGYFLLKMLSLYGYLAVLVGGALWISSNYIVLANLYSYNPNPVILLTPLFVFLLARYLRKPSYLLSIGFWFLGGLFFNFEMAAGVFIPPIIFFSLLLSGKGYLLKDKSFWIGCLLFVLALLPQLFFELRHDFFMSKSVLNYLRDSSDPRPYLLPVRLKEVLDLYLGVLSGTLMNWQWLVKISLFLFLITPFFLKGKTEKRDNIILVAVTFILVSFIGHVLIPANFMPWHLGGVMAAVVIVLGIVIGKLASKSGLVRTLTLLLSILIIGFAFQNLNLKEQLFSKRSSNDPSVFSNELAAIDYVYNKSEGKNFKVYTYLPSVIDYQYQYLIWWRGLIKYGYLPTEYAYLPDKPVYINDKEKLDTGEKPVNSGLIFLIKQPDTIGQRHLWENSFKYLPLLESTRLGPLVIETRREFVDNK